MKNKLFLIFFSLILIIFAQGFISAGCSGTPAACNTNNGDQPGCVAAGCTYGPGISCHGTPAACSTFITSTTCTDNACTWTDSPATIVQGGGTTQAIIGVFSRSPLGGDNVEYKKVIPLEVQVYYAGKPINTPFVKANSSMFGEVALTHPAGSPDGTYRTNVTVNENTLPGTQRIVYTASYLGQFNEISVLFNLIYPLNVNVPLNNNYNKGDDLVFKGTVFDLKNVSIPNANIKVQGYSQGNKIFETSAISDQNGSFSTDYFLKYYDKEGTWNIVITALSNDGRVGGIGIPIEVSSASGVDYYIVNFLSPLQNSIYKRGEIIPITIEVKDIQNVIRGASVTVSTPNKDITTLKEVQPGVYSGEYLIKSNDELGKLFLKADVIKQLQDFKKVGGASLPIEVGSAKIDFAFISPDTDVTYTNSRLNIKIKLTYPDGSLVKGASIDASLSNGKIISLTESSDGIYGGDYFVPEEDLGSLTMTLNAKDIGGNLGGLTKTVYVKKRTAIENILFLVLDFFKKYAWAIVVFVVISGFIAKPNFELAWIKNRLTKLKEEMKRIKLMQIETERKYFKEGSINKREFKKIMTGFEDRLTKSQETRDYYEKKLVEKLKQYKQK